MDILKSLMTSQNTLKLKYLKKLGKKTPAFVRFSTVLGERGSSDTDRDPRGFAIKFYTEEGNWDLVGNNSPVFVIRDPIKFPDFTHSHKRNPQTDLKDNDTYWDFLSHTPEGAHQLTFLFSDRGTPDGYRHMHGFGAHTFKFVNSAGEVFFCKMRLKTDVGIKNMTDKQAKEMKSVDMDYATRELFTHIQNGNTANWTFLVQIMPEKDAENYEWNIFDLTKVWPHKDYPEIPVGKLVLNRNPENYFAEVEQVAFNPGHLVPGIEVTNDRILQGRLFSYPDTQRHRLGLNFQQLPINCPYMTRVANHQRDGPATFTNQGNSTNYEPNSFGGPIEDKKFAIAPIKLYSNVAKRQDFGHKNCDYTQPNWLYSKVMNDTDRAHLISNMSGHLGKAKQFIQERQVKIFYKCHSEYGMRLAKGMNLNVNFAAKF